MTADGPDSSDETDLGRWLARLTSALDTDVDVPQQQLLDLARIAAHGIARPAAPLTTFVVGYVAGLRGGGPAELERVLAATLAALDDAQ